MVLGVRQDTVEVIPHYSPQVIPPVFEGTLIPQVIPTPCYYRDNDEC